MQPMNSINSVDNTNAMTNQYQFVLKLKNLNKEILLDHLVLRNHGLSQNYQADIQINIQALTLSSLLLQPAQLIITSPYGSNHWHGIITDVHSTGVTSDQKWYSYSLYFQSPLCLLQYNTNHKIFLNCSVIDAISQLLTA